VTGERCGSLEKQARCRSAPYWRSGNQVHDGADQRSSVMDDKKEADCLEKHRNTPYYKINREERHYVAIIFALLLRFTPATIEGILLNLGLRVKDWSKFGRKSGEDFGIYYEYAFLRDMWHQLAGDNDGKRNFLEGILKKRCVDYSSIIDENSDRPFGSKIYNQKNDKSRDVISPAQWSATKICNLLKEEASELLKVKWAFSAKPDLVIQFDKNHAVCFEFKLESGQTTYTAGCNGKPVSVTQTDLQIFILKYCLKIKNVVHVMVEKSHKSSKELSQKADGSLVFCKTWTELIEEIETASENSPSLADAALREVPHMKKAICILKNGFSQVC
jgi:hypothetical protein